MKRVLLTIPEGTTFEALTEEQQAAINSIFGQYVMPMPGTQVFDGTVICDAICADNFDPAVMTDFGLSDWTIIGMWSWDFIADEVTEIVPLDEAVFVAHMIPKIEVDDDGNITAETPYTEPRETAKVAGWPDCF